MNIILAVNREARMLSAYGRLRELALALMDVGAVLTAESNHLRVIERNGPEGKERGFLLKLHEKTPNAPLSPFFLNLRTPENPTPGTLTPEIVELASRCMWGALAAEENIFDFDLIVGVPRAGDPFAKVLANIACAGLILLGKETRNGTRKIVLSEGIPPLVRGQNALLVDDMITRADSKLEAIEVLRDNGLTVEHVVVIADREQGGREQLAEHGCKLHTLFTISDLLDLCYENGRISRKLRDEILAYLGIVK